MANVETIKSICNDKVVISFTSIHLPIFRPFAAVFVRHNLFVYFCSSLYLFLCLLLFNKTVWAHQWDSNLNDCCEWQAHWPCNRCHDDFIYSLSCLSLFNTLSFLIPLYLCICFFVFIIKISPVSYHPESFSVYLSSTIFLFLSILLFSASVSMSLLTHFVTSFLLYLNLRCRRRRNAQNSKSFSVIFKLQLSLIVWSRSKSHFR